MAKLLPVYISYKNTKLIYKCQDTPIQDYDNDFDKDLYGKANLDFHAHSQQESCPKY